jgi:prevent-host-death family protein
MPEIINIHEAKTHLSRLVEQVAAGSEVIIAKAGKPMARLAPLVDRARVKELGLLRGKRVVPENFNDPLDEATIADFEGR